MAKFQNRMELKLNQKIYWGNCAALWKSKKKLHILFSKKLLCLVLLCFGYDAIRAHLWQLAQNLPIPSEHSNTGIVNIFQLPWSFLLIKQKIIVK